MKCKICGQRANSLKSMNAHYRKAHPGHNKKVRAAKKALGDRVLVDVESKMSGSCTPRSSGARFCKWCGGRQD